jgi:hypothetical protein
MRLKMGIIRNIGVFAIGIGYCVNIQDAPKCYNTISQKIEQLAGKYPETPSTNIAGHTDLDINYVVTDGFQGYLPENPGRNVTTIVCGDEVAIMIFFENNKLKPITTIIKNQPIAKGYESDFKYLWKKIVIPKN